MNEFYSAIAWGKHELGILNSVISNQYMQGAMQQSEASEARKSSLPMPPSVLESFK